MDKQHSRNGPPTAADSSHVFAPDSHLPTPRSESSLATTDHQQTSSINMPAPQAKAAKSSQPAAASAATAASAAASSSAANASAAARPSQAPATAPATAPAPASAQASAGATAAGATASTAARRPTILKLDPSAPTADPTPSTASSRPPVLQRIGSVPEPDESSFMVEFGHMLSKEAADIEELWTKTQPDAQKPAVLKEKYFTLFSEKKRLDREHEHAKRNLAAIARERDTYKSDMLREKALKEKLESLCREMQRQAREAEEKRNQDAAVDQQKRDELSARFETTIEEIKQRMAEESQDKQRRSEDNDTRLREQYKSFLEQYELRERHFRSVLKSKDLEYHLCQAKCEQYRQKAEYANNKIEALGARLSLVSKTEADLGRQLSLYIEKFRQVEETLSKSNELFTTFRKEMEQMSKKNKKLEVDCVNISKRVHDLEEEQKLKDQELQAANASRSKMESLCRAMQTERSGLLKLIAYYETRYNARPPEAAPNGNAAGDGTGPAVAAASAAGRPAGHGPHDPAGVGGGAGGAAGTLQPTTKHPAAVTGAAVAGTGAAAATNGTAAVQGRPPAGPPGTAAAAPAQTHKPAHAPSATTAASNHTSAGGKSANR